MHNGRTPRAAWRSFCCGVCWTEDSQGDLAQIDAQGDLAQFLLRFVIDRGR
jgi:hypothetical protein